MRGSSVVSASRIFRSAISRRRSSISAAIAQPAGPRGGLVFWQFWQWVPAAFSLGVGRGGDQVGSGCVASMSLRGPAKTPTEASGCIVRRRPNALNQLDRFQRKAPVADRGLGLRAPPRVASGRTGVRAIAAIRLRAWSTLHRPFATSRLVRFSRSHKCATGVTGGQPFLARDRDDVFAHLGVGQLNCPQIELALL